MKNKKPLFYTYFKILSLCFLAMAIAGITLSVKGFGDFDSNNFMLGGVLTGFGVVLTFLFFFIGFSPEIQKFAIKSSKYIQSENKQDLKDIANTSADIISPAVTKTASAVKEGLSNKKYCKYCGKQIDDDAKFCSYCGKEQ